MTTSWHTYPSIYALGHKALIDLLNDPVLVEEKMDGSQFSFGRIEDENGDYLFKARSKGAILNDPPDKMFAKGVEIAKSLPLRPGWTYRTEYLIKPKHNTLAYNRIPLNHLIVFDINDGHESYLSYEDKSIEAQRLGLECVPLLYAGMLSDLTLLRGYLDHLSVLGGSNIEGVVVKNYSRFGPDKKVLMGKFVSEAFKEIHGNTWKTNNPSQGDIIEKLGLTYRTPARWAKAIQHLKEAGTLEGDLRDIGQLIQEVPRDIEKECKEEILEALWSWAWPKIRRGVHSGLPEWYKEELLKQQFNEPSDVEYK